MSSGFWDADDTYVGLLTVIVTFLDSFFFGNHNIAIVPLNLYSAYSYMLLFDDM